MMDQNTREALQVRTASAFAIHAARLTLVEVPALQGARSLATLRRAMEMCWTQERNLRNARRIKDSRLWAQASLLLADREARA